MAVPAVLAVTACGAGSDGGGHRTAASASKPRPDPGLAHAELVRRAQAICTRSEAAIERSVPPGGALNLVGLIVTTDASNKLAAPALDELQRLRPKRADAPAWSAYLAAERRLLAANRAIQRIVRTGTAEAIHRTVLAAGRPSTGASRAARAAGLPGCANGPDVRIGGEQTPARRPAAGATRRRLLLDVDVEVSLPRGWRRLRIDEPSARAFGDDVNRCAFEAHARRPPGDGSPAALFAYAGAQVRGARRHAQSYHLIAIQRERAANATGIGIVRTSRSEGRVLPGHVAFFFALGRRYVVDCLTDTPAHLARADREVFTPIIRTLRIAERPGR